MSAWCASSARAWVRRTRAPSIFCSPDSTADLTKKIANPDRCNVKLMRRWIHSDPDLFLLYLFHFFSDITHRQIYTYMLCLCTKLTGRVFTVCVCAWASCTTMNSSMQLMPEVLRWNGSDGGLSVKTTIISSNIFSLETEQLSTFSQYCLCAAVRTQWVNVMRPEWTGMRSCGMRRDAGTRNQQPIQHSHPSKPFSRHWMCKL